MGISNTEDISVAEVLRWHCFRHNRNTENGSENVTGEIED